MKHLNLIMSFLIVVVLFMMWAGSVYAGITCYPNPQRTHTTCVSDTGQSWTVITAPNGTSTTIPIYTPPDRTAPKHNYSECTVATGCIPSQ